MDLWPKFATSLPWNHYSRKNIGYLRAYQLGVEYILDTDDDNFPTVNPWKFDFARARNLKVESWVNIYRYFGEERLWPRGLPLVHVNDIVTSTIDSPFPDVIDCFQSIVDGDPDLDAIGRMLYPAKISFDNSLPVILNSASCPTNSQATIWSSWLIPLLYLPSTTTFRMTDIWRGLIIQPAIKKLNGVTVFGKLGFEQERNMHDNYMDFSLEAEGHLQIPLLNSTCKKFWENYRGDRNADNLLECLIGLYRILSEKNLVESSELALLDSWAEALRQC